MAHGVDWFLLDPGGCEWFHRVAWDLWIAAVGVDEVTFVAATDTD